MSKTIKVGSKVKVISVISPISDNPMWDDNLIGETGIVTDINPDFNPIDSEPIIVLMDKIEFREPGGKCHHGFFDNMLEIK